MFTHPRLPAFLSAIAVATACCDVWGAPFATPAEEFTVASIQRWAVLDPDVRAYARRADDCEQQIEALGATYDAIMTEKSRRFRDTLINNYWRDLPTATTERSKLRREKSDLMREMDEAYDWLHQRGNDQYKVLTSYKDLDEVIRKGREAVRKVNGMVRMPPQLPDPIPLPVPPAQVVGLRYPDPNLADNPDLNTWVPFEVMVRNNAEYTERIVEVRPLDRNKQAKFGTPLTQKVTIPPGETKILTFKWMCVKDCNVDIVAEVVEPK